MTPLFKKIQVIFLFLAVSMLNAHLIIPHDHHQADSDLCQENSCPASQNNNSHHSGLPVHCHACNDLASEKAIIYNVFKYEQATTLLAGCLSEKLAYYPHLSWIRIFDTKNKPVIARLLEFTSPRAPPSFS
jgi:hypothetical protein